MQGLLEREREACYLRNKEEAACLMEALPSTFFEQPICPQNEAAALSSCLIKGNKLDPHARVELEALCSTYCERTGFQGNSTESEAGPSGRPFPEGSQEALLHSWCSSQGLQTRISPATFGSGLRGVQADADLAAGDVAVSIPASCLISFQTALDSDLGKALRRIPGLSEEALAVIWTMIDRVDAESLFAPYWQSLPSSFGTALGVQEELLGACLKGSALLEEARQARKHIQEQYQALTPVLETLARAYPQFVPPHAIAWESYLWAVECWYAYAIQVQMQPSDKDTCPCLAPYVGLINHSPWPHAVHFSAVDPQTGRLNVRLFRPCKAGQQFFISYGPLPNAKLLLFYGFCVPNNPYDYAYLSIQDLATVATGEVKQSLLDTHRGECRISMKDPMPRQLLAAARAVAMGPKELEEIQQKQQQSESSTHEEGKRRKKGKGKGGGKALPDGGCQNRSAQQFPLWLMSFVDAANESAALQLLSHTISRRLCALPGSTPAASGDICEGNSRFAAAAAQYIEQQRQALQAALAECQQRLG